MFESNLAEGRQDVPANGELKYGVSIVRPVAVLRHRRLVLRLFTLSRAIDRRLRFLGIYVSSGSLMSRRFIL